MIKTAIQNIYKYKIAIIILIGIVLRLAFIGRIPGNYNFQQDEAFSAYEAYSMVTYGMDSHGYHNPVYLETWGSGMSAVQCYFQTFFVRILGLTPVAVRLPQAILGCITLIFFYLLIKELATANVAFWATTVLAISPWHIQMSRWGVDCNYFIGFVTIAMYLIVSSRNKPWKTILAAIFTAITLYSYASPWIVMPILVYGTIIYLFVKKEINLKSIIVFTVVLGVLAIPLFLFILVNIGFIDEIRTNFISIPKLTVFRSGDVKPGLSNLKTLFKYFWTQNDLVSYDFVAGYGNYFIFSNVFIIIGLIKDIVKRNKYAFVMWIWFACGIVMGAMIDPNFERINLLFLPLFYFIGTGIVAVIDLLKDYKKIPSIAMGLLYGITAVLCTRYYFTGYNQMMERVWSEGTQEAIEFALNYDGTIHIQDIRHPYVLLYSRYPVDKYIETVQYVDDNAKFLQPLSYEGYDYTDYTMEDAVSGDIYICSTENTAAVEWIVSQDMDCAQFGTYYVAIAR